jgi:hypothetical protein
MFTITATTTRSSTSTPWFNATPAGSIFTTLYQDPLITAYQINGEDSLSRSLSLTFNSYDEYQSWLNKINEADGTLLLKRNDYIVANAMTLKIEESIDGGTPIIEKLL